MFGQLSALTGCNPGNFQLQVLGITSNRAEGFGSLFKSKILPYVVPKMIKSFLRIKYMR